ncbi:MAG: ATP-binding protein [Betaproteobacteria bacterium]|nr:ATP-binding protein [Betaproteobacteria bacterium]
MRPQSLKFKVTFFVTLALSAAMVAFTLAVVQHQRTALLNEAAAHVTRLSEVITQSTRFAMLQNQPAYVDRIIRDVADLEGIARVRILNKEGRIIHSTQALERGRTVDRNAEGCFLCHQSEKPLAQVPRSERWRIFDAPAGGRLLASMEVVRNEPSCYTAACHAHSKDQSVLGVLDIAYSLDDIDRTMRRNTVTVVGFGVGFIIIAAFALGVLVHRLVYVPLRDLEAGAKKLATGDLGQSIPVRSADEFGQVAAAFNAMTVALRDSRSELTEWGHKLEQKVAERTRKLRAAEAGAAEREKLASVGLLAAGIAHELNNPLTGILTFSHVIRKKLADGSQDAEDLDLVIRETKRCATIIRRLLDFARQRPPEKKYADLNRVIADTVRLVERPANLHEIEITLDLDPGLPQVWIDEDLIKQVVMNVLVNAQHAITGKGSISVRSRRVPRPADSEPGAVPVPMVEVSIADTGCGIAAQDLKRIFDPFFTSKGVGKGTGLGLSVSHGIVVAHGGAIEVQSAPGEGSTFHIYLPMQPPAAEAGGAAAGEPR